jgi:hypothetical protein
MESLANEGTGEGQTIFDLIKQYRTCQNIVNISVLNFCVAPVHFALILEHEKAKGSLFLP